jgi:hypothetical protein
LRLHQKSEDYLNIRAIEQTNIRTLEQSSIRTLSLRPAEDVAYIWTSGRLCNFKGCDREDLQPTIVNGWFWSGSGVKMAPTNATPPGWPYQESIL